MKRIWIVLLAISLLVACGGNSKNKPLDASYDEDKVKTKATEVIEAIAVEDWEKIRGICSEETRAALTDEVLKKVSDEVLSKLGKLEEIKEMQTMDLVRKGSEVHYALVIAKVKFENKEMIFTLSFNPKMEMVDYFMK